MKQPSVVGSLRWFVESMLRCSYVEIAAVYFTAILSFGFLYFSLAIWMPDHAPTIPKTISFSTLFDALYFSAMTATSVGYGDIVPLGLSKLIATAESFFALFVFGILIAKPISERQETAIRHMHKLTLDDIFSTMREGFFIMRKDCDAIMDEVIHTKKLSERSMENLETALRHGHVLVEDVPTFYDTEKLLYIIDTKREKLLTESVERTLARVQRTFAELTAYDIPWKSNVPVHAALLELVAIAHNVIARWKHVSSETAQSGLSRVEQSLKRLESML